MPKSLDHCQPAPSAVRLLEQCLLHRDLFSEPRAAQACRRAIDWIQPKTPDMKSEEPGPSPRFEQDPIDRANSLPLTPECLATRFHLPPSVNALCSQQCQAASDFLYWNRSARRWEYRLKPASF